MAVSRYLIGSFIHDVGPDGQELQSQGIYAWLITVIEIHLIRIDQHTWICHTVQRRPTETTVFPTI